MQWVFLHAFPLDRRMWRAEIDRLGPAAYAPDLYAFGETMDAWAAGVLAHAANGPLVVVGCSMGGSCALEVVRQAPERVAAVVLVGASARHRPDPIDRDHYLDATRVGGAEGVWSALAPRLFGADTHPEIIERAATIARQQHAENLMRAIRVFHSRRDAMDVVASWDGPLIVVSGDADTFVPPAKSHATVANSVRGIARIIPSCGHYVNLEQPVAFARILSDVARRVGREIS